MQWNTLKHCLRQLLRARLLWGCRMWYAPPRQKQFLILPIPGPNIATIPTKAKLVGFSVGIARWLANSWSHSILSHVYLMNSNLHLGIQKRFLLLGKVRQLLFKNKSRRDRTKSNCFMNYNKRRSIYKVWLLAKGLWPSPHSKFVTCWHIVSKTLKKTFVDLHCTIATCFFQGFLL